MYEWRGSFRKLYQISICIKRTFVNIYSENVFRENILAFVFISCKASSALEKCNEFDFNMKKFLSLC